VRFFESLDRMVQNEPWLERDKAMIDLLRSVDIEKGKLFNPETATKEILNAATREARAWLNLRFETSLPPYYEGRQWAVVAPPEALQTMPTLFETPDRYSVDTRGLMYSYAFASEKHLGGGQFYLFTLRDNAGNFLDGGKTYRVTIPANVPVKQYWSAVPYDRATHTFFRDVPYVGVGSQTPGLRTNADGSADLYTGPTPPPGNINALADSSTSGQNASMPRSWKMSPCEMFDCPHCGAVYALRYTQLPVRDSDSVYCEICRQK
jgi:hypothetical protein